MAIFVNIDERAAAVIVVVAVLVIWAVVSPDSFSQTVDQGISVIEGAIDGAMGEV